MEGDNIFRYRNMDIKLGGKEIGKITYKKLRKHLMINIFAYFC